MDRRLRTSRLIFRTTSTNSGIGCRQGATSRRRCDEWIFRRWMAVRARWAFQLSRIESPRKLSVATLSRVWSRRSTPTPLSLTHNFRPDHGAQPDIGEPRQAAPYDNVSRRRIIGACEIAAQSGDLGQIVRKGFPPQGNSALILDELVEQLDFGLGQGGTWY